MKVSQSRFRRAFTSACCFVAVALSPLAGAAELRAGTGQTDITPPAGTPSAGYGARMGKGMEGVHDPLLATAVALDNGEKKIVFLGVDHLGFTREMVEAVKAKLKENPSTADYELYLGSSHTHAGGGGFLNLGGIGEVLAGKYSPEAYQLYIDGSADAVLKAVADMQAAQAGVGYGEAPGLNGYRGDWPPNINTRPELAVIKVVTAEGEPLAALFNYAAHPTVLGEDNMQFSADYVGPAREAIADLVGEGVQPVFFNGAQGDVSPRPPDGADDFARAAAMGKAIGEEVKRVWDNIETSSTLKIETFHLPYDVEPKPSSSGLSLGLGSQPSELNLIVLNDVDAFVTVPGELSCMYDHDIKRFGQWVGYRQVSVLGLTNDAHGYIMNPESWRHKTYESTVSFGGELYGQRITSMVYAMLHELEPDGAYQEDQTESTALEVLDGR